MDWIDLRSDTVTWPTPAMREAMARAAVGDDVYGEDPTIHRLEARAAELTGKEACLFVASGTMGNLIAVLTHCQRGDEVILGDKAHMFVNEGGGMAALGGVHPHPVPNRADGGLDMDAVQAALRDPHNPHHPRSRLVALENTHNICGGVAVPLEHMREVADWAYAHGLSVHLDGARLFNAALALGVPAREVCAPVDSVMFCLSKGLSAPVGSLLCGSAAFIAEARRWRKMVGGGMRQAGVLAAAGLVALEEILPRLAEDHRRARQLAQGLQQVPGVALDFGLPQTNMVYFSLTEEVPWDAAEVARRLEARRIKVDVEGPRRFRLVTHYWIDDQAVETVMQAFQEVLGTRP